MNKVIEGQRTSHQFIVEPDRVLLDVLREDSSVDRGQTVLRPQRAVRRLHGHRQRQGRPLLSTRRWPNWKALR